MKLLRISCVSVSYFFLKSAFRQRHASFALTRLAHCWFIEVNGASDSAPSLEWDSIPINGTKIFFFFFFNSLKSLRSSMGKYDSIRVRRALYVCMCMCIIPVESLHALVWVFQKMKALSRHMQSLMHIHSIAMMRSTNKNLHNYIKNNKHLRISEITHSNRLAADENLKSFLCTYCFTTFQKRIKRSPHCNFVVGPIVCIALPVVL